MGLNSLFKLREQATKEIVTLLDTAVLGTNGAHYKHLDSKEKIEQADSPLFLTLERNESTLGNVTFCRRERLWYVRHFAFTPLLQSTGKSKSKGHGLLKRELTQFFTSAFEGEYGEAPHALYAYIDPENEKSLWMSENFGFEKSAEITTQTFSRINPKVKVSVQKVEAWREVKEFVRAHFGNQTHYFEAQVNQGPYYVWRSEDKDILGFAKISTAKWEIKRFPGRLGGFLVKAMPFIPGLSKILKPKNHVFLAPEAVFVKDPSQMGVFLESILNLEQQKLMIWWVDKRDPNYVASQNCTNWGILNRFIGTITANLVVKRNPNMTQKTDSTNSVYTSGFDFI